MTTRDRKKRTIHKEKDMADKFKYTTDGKKVVVIGHLNSTDTIVQEIFVTDDGGEIPSGEQFVVKSLHDQPVKSWHEKEMERIERSCSRMNVEHDRISNDLARERGLAKATISSLRKLSSGAAQEHLQVLEDFVAGKITHVLEIGHSSCKIVDFHETNSCGNDRRVENIKLLTLFGRSDGTLIWRRNHYSDFSGSNCDIVPAYGLDDAIKKAQELFDARAEKWREETKALENPKTRPFRPDWLTGLGAGKLIVPDDVVQFWRDYDLSNLDSSIERKKKELQELKDRRKAFEDGS